MFWRTNPIQKLSNIGHRDSSRWLQLVLVIVMITTTSSCRNAVESKPAESTNQEKSAPNSDVEQESAAPEAADTKPEDVEKPAEFVSQELLSSPFTKETVLALNAIVSRSLAAIESFDKQRKEMEDGDEADVDLAVKQYTKLSEQAKQARVDMEAAKKRLQESGEKYNEAIFAAMVRFVENVDDEIKKEIEDVRSGQNNSSKQ